MNFPKKWPLVLGQFLIIASLALSSRAIAATMAISAIGLGLAIGIVAIWQMVQSSKLSIFPEPVSTGQLVVKGIYKYLRHPMYTALLLCALGLVLTHALWWRWILWLGLILILVKKIAVEEKMLSTKFERYTAYKKHSWRLIPFVW